MIQNLPIISKTKSHGWIIDTRKAASGPKGVFAVQNFEWNRLMEEKNLHGWLNTLATSGNELKQSECELLFQVSKISNWKQGKSPASEFEIPFGDPLTALRGAGCTYGEMASYRDKTRGGPIGELLNTISSAGRNDLIESLPHVLMPYAQAHAGAWPEVFEMGTAGQGRQVLTSGKDIGVRWGSNTTLLEAELVLLFNRRGELCAVSFGNDVTASDVESLLTLLLGIAKVFNGCAAISPGWAVLPEPLPLDSAAMKDLFKQGFEIEIRVLDQGGAEFLTAKYNVNTIKRTAGELGYIAMVDRCRDHGTALFCGAGWLQPHDKPLKAGQLIEISSPTLGPDYTLVTGVERLQDTLPIPREVQANMEARRNLLASV